MSTNDDHRRILIVRLTAIGDVIHVLPCFAALRKTFPDAFIGWVVEDRAMDIIRGLDGLDALHVVPRRAWRKDRRSSFGRLADIRKLRAEMRARKYQIAIDFQGLTKSGVAGWLSGAPRRIGYGDADGREVNKLFTNERIVPPESAVHVVDRNAALLSPLGIDRVEAEFPMAWDKNDAKTADGFIESLELKPDETLAVLNPGAGWVTKRWEPRRFGELAARLVAEDGCRVVAVWAGDEEKAMAETIVRVAGDGAHLAPPTTLRELAALLSKSGLFVGSDTGPMHMAAGLGVPTVALFGAADHRRNGPYGPSGRVVTAGVDCSPCWLADGCPHDLKCMTEITVEMVLATAQEAIASDSSTAPGCGQ